MINPKKPQTGIRLNAHLAEKLEYIKQRDGIPYSEQVRRALTLWFEQKGLDAAEEPKPRLKKVARG